MFAQYVRTFSWNAFHADDIELRKLANSVALDLIKKCGDLGVTNVVIPCVDHSSLKTPDEINIFTDEIQKVIPYAESFGVKFWPLRRI